MSNSTMLAAIIQADPSDWQARLVYADALEEAGLPGHDSERRIAHAIRHPAGIKLSACRTTDLRSRCGLSGRRCPVTIVDGNAPPTRRGEEGYSAFKDGGACHSPGAAIRAGYKIHYVASTLMITVGVLWLVREKWIR